MDLIVYLLLLLLLGVIRVKRTEQISSDEGIAYTGATIVDSQYEDLPIGQNLQLYKEVNAYTLILEDLGLI